MPRRTYGRHTPWGRLAEWRRHYDVIIDRMIDKFQADPDLTNRTDFLSLLLRSAYEDGSAMSRKDIHDDLLTLLVAGHETTATTLAWVFDCRQHLAVPRQPGGFSRPGSFRSAALHRIQAVHVCVDPVRRRNPTLRGAAFAKMEMNVVLRTVLRHLTIQTTTAPGEKLQAGGLGYLPKDGGRIVARRR